jgi:hypothetical protein
MRFFRVVCEWQKVVNWGAVKLGVVGWAGLLRWWMTASGRLS